MWQVDVATDTQALDALRAEWIALVDRCPSATVFQTFEWISNWWLQVGRIRLDRKPYVISVRDEAGMLVGLAPFLTSLWHGTPIRRLSFMGAGVSDYNDIIAEEGLEQAACEAIYTHLASSLSWQIGDFAHLREGSLCRAHPPSATSGLVCSEHPLEKCPYLPYPPITDADRWASLLKNYSKKTRSHIGYYERRLKGIFEVENGLVESQDQLPDAMTALFELHRRRWNKRWLPGVLGSSQMQSFHRAVAKDFLTRGWLRLHYLILDGDYQAVLYCFAFGDRTCYYQGGFEPTMARHSLGSVLTATAIKQSINESKLEFDFLRGDEPYKERWTQGHSRMNIRRLVAKRGTPMLRWAQQAHILEHKIETRFKDFMHHAYTKDQPKKVSAAESEGESDH